MKHLEIFELYKKPTLIENNVYKHLDLLKSYIDIVKKYNHDNGTSANDIVLNYFIIVHNFLILEIGFEEYIPEIYKINKTLLSAFFASVNQPTKVNNFKDVYKEFLKIYEPDTTTRYSIEKISDVEIIREYLKDKPNYYNTLIDNINEELQNILTFKITRKYNL